MSRSIYQNNDRLNTDEDKEGNVMKRSCILIEDDDHLHLCAKDIEIKDYSALDRRILCCDLIGLADNKN